MGLFDRFKIHKPTAKERQAKIIGDPFKMHKKIEQHPVTEFRLPASIKRAGKKAFERFKEASIEAAERAREEERKHPHKSGMDTIREECIRLHEEKFGKTYKSTNRFSKINTVFR